MEWAAYMQRDYIVRPGDRLSVRVDLPTSNEQETERRDNIQAIIVSPTGTIDLRRLPGPLQVAGKSMSEVRTLTLEAYKREFNEVRIGVQLTEAAVQSVYVCGEVRGPGAVPYRPGMTMMQAISQTGSFDITVKHNDIRILRINPDGTQRTFRVNMEAVLHDQQPDFLLPAWRRCLCADLRDRGCRQLGGALGPSSAAVPDRWPGIRNGQLAARPDGDRCRFSARLHGRACLLRGRCARSAVRRVASDCGSSG